jgi:DNA-directed RNA polymerase subunit RPC12/RpoP
MKTCAFCTELLEDDLMECPKCGHSRFIQVRTKAPAEKTEVISLPERTLSDIHLLLLEGLHARRGFVDASQFIMSLPFEDESQAQLAVAAIQEMVDGGLIEVSGRSKIKITSLGSEMYRKEKDLPGGGK